MTEAHGGAGRAKEETSAVEIAALFANFVDVLIPGDERWPTASVVGVQAVLATRLADLGGEGEIDRLVAALLAAGAPFTGKDDAERRAIVADFERRHDTFFGLVRNAVYLAYYESPAVAAVIRSLGYTYKLRPHIEGYAMPPVDPGRDAPRHGRGSYVPTKEVRRLDLSSLPGIVADRKEGADGHG